MKRMGKRELRNRNERKKMLEDSASLEDAIRQKLRGFDQSGENIVMNYFFCFQ